MQKKIFKLVLLAHLFIVLLSWAQDSKAISVLYFSNTSQNQEYGWLSKGLADMLITDLSEVKGLTVVEREELEKIIKEQQRSASDLFDENSACRLGMLLASKHIIMGSFIVLNNTLRIDLKLVEVESGKITKALSKAGELSKLFELQRSLTGELIKALDLAVPEKLTQTPSQSLQAVKAYYQGIEFLDQGAFAEAEKLFKQAISLDPYYLKPQQSLEDAYRFLKDFKKQRYQRELKTLFEKAKAIKARLDAPRWQSYADFLNDCYQRGLSYEEINKLVASNPALLAGNTPAECLWNLQQTLFEIAIKAEEYFADTDTSRRMFEEIIFLTSQGYVRFSQDPFWPEILYSEILALRYLGNWEALKTACESLMLSFPDYRMMWSVEDFYEQALSNLANQ